MYLNIRLGRFRVWITNGSYPSMTGVKLNSCQLNKCYLFYRRFVIRDDMVCFDVLFGTTWSCFSSAEDFIYFCFCSIHWEMSCIVINLGKCSCFNSIFCLYIALCILWCVQLSKVEVHHFSLKFNYRILAIINNDKVRLCARFSYSIVKPLERQTDLILVVLCIFTVSHDK